MFVAFNEITGELKPAIGPVSAEHSGPTVVISDLTRGYAQGRQANGFTLRYVGSGEEHYRIGGRHYKLGVDQLMIAPQNLRSEVEIPNLGAQNTLGMCIYLPAWGSESLELLEQPIVLPASCSLGRMMKDGLVGLRRSGRGCSEPQLIAQDARFHLEQMLPELERQIEGLPATKRGTNFETLRRMSIARAYLHQVTHRPVTLQELASEAAVSPFHLLRRFRECFGQTPAAYHRRLRLTLAKEAAAANSQTLEFVADRYGFAGGASLSHAHRRAFGTAPVRSLGETPAADH